MERAKNKFILKDVYREFFRTGVACEKINDRFTGHEIGNPEKEALMKEQFNSMTFGITIGLDGAVPQPLTTVDTASGEWTKVTARAELAKELNSAEIYVETDGNADFYVDEVLVCPVK